MKSPNPDAAAFELFNRQHGFALVTSLYKLGLAKDQVAYRVAKGLYTRVARGVIALGTPEMTPFAWRCARC